MRIAICIAVALTVAPGAPGQVPPEPEPDLLQTLLGTDGAASSAAGERLLRMGKQAVPILLRGLERERAGSPGFRTITRNFGRLGRDAASALPRLLQALRQAEAGHEDILRAIDAIAPYAPDLRADVIDALAHLMASRREKRFRTIQVRLIATSRTRLDVDHTMSTEQLIRVLGSGNTAQRAVAAELLVGAPGSPEQKLPALLRCLDDASTAPRRIQAQFDTPGASMAIRTSIDREAESISVAKAISRLAPTREVPIRAWIILLGDEEPAILRRAMRAVGAARAGDALSPLLSLTRSDDPTVRWEAVTTLGMLGAAAERAIPSLTTLSGSADRGTAVRARAALQTIRGDLRRKP